MLDVLLLVSFFLKIYFIFKIVYVGVHSHSHNLSPFTHIHIINASLKETFFLWLTDSTVTMELTDGIGPRKIVLFLFAATRYLTGRDVRQESLLLLTTWGLALHGGEGVVSPALSVVLVGDLPLWPLTSHTPRTGSRNCIGSWGQAINRKATSLHNSLLLGRPHLPKVPQASQRVLPTAERVLKHMRPCRTFSTQILTAVNTEEDKIRTKVFWLNSWMCVTLYSLKTNPSN